MIVTKNQSFATPDAPTEKVLHKVWQELLGIPNLSIHDDFYELGNHSIISVNMMSKIGNLSFLRKEKSIRLIAILD